MREDGLDPDGDNFGDEFVENITEGNGSIISKGGGGILFKDKNEEIQF